MSEPIVITRDKVHRGWSDLEPKIAIAGVAGFLAIIAMIVAHQFHVTLPSEVASIVPLSFALLAGYLTPSSGTVVTKRSDNSTTTESHSAPTVTTITAPTQVQRAPSATQMYPQPGSFTAVVEGAPQSLEPIVASGPVPVDPVPVEGSNTGPVDVDQTPTEIIPPRRSTW